MMRRRASRFMVSRPCEHCHGKRLKPESLRVTFAGLDIAQASRLPLKALAEMLHAAADGLASDQANEQAPGQAGGQAGARSALAAARCRALHRKKPPRRGACAARSRMRAHPTCGAPPRSPKKSGSPRSASRATCASAWPPCVNLAWATSRWTANTHALAG
jgi:hypothetical protein